MSRLKIELESCYAEDRAESLQIAHAENLEEIAKLTASFNAKEKVLRDEVFISDLWRELEQLWVSLSDSLFSDSRIKEYSCRSE